MTEDDGVHRYLQFRPVARVGTAASALIGIVAGLGLVVSLSFWDNFHRLEQFIAGDPAATVESLIVVQDTADVLYWIHIGGLAAAGVVLIWWLHLTRWNATILCNGRHTRTAPWVWWGWVVPVVSFWFPYQVVRDIAKASDPTTPRDIDSLRLVGGDWRVRGWWTCWVCAAVIKLAGGALVSESAATRLEELRALSVLSTVSTGLDIAAAVLLIMIIRQIGRWQTQPRQGKS